jgi:hypothetical protein
VGADAVDTSRTDTDIKPLRDPFTIDRAKALSGATELADLEDVDDEQLAACLDDHAGDGVEVSTARRRRT